MNTRIALFALLAFAVAPSVALATTVSASLIPDGTYVVKVEQVPDAAHVTVKMDNGMETTLTAAGSVNFSKIKANDTIKVSLIKGKVPVYAVQ
jgi:translation initiation factor IF-1